MKPEFLSLWLAGGVIVILTIRAALILKNVCEARHDAEHEEFYQFLIHPETAPVPRDRPTWFAWTKPHKALQELLSVKSDAA